jgi:hypothetical protein
VSSPKEHETLPQLPATFRNPNAELTETLDLASEELRLLLLQAALSSAGCTKLPVTLHTAATELAMALDDCDEELHYGNTATATKCASLLSWRAKAGERRETKS